MILKNAIDKLFKIREDAARARPGADEGFDPHEKPFLDHLEDLRETLMKMGATLLVLTVISFAFNKQIFKFLQLPAKRTNLEDGSTLQDKIDFFVLAPHDMLMLMIKTAFFAAVVIALPLLVYFAFQFILPGLRQMEKKMIIPGAGVGFILFLIGASFAFFLAAPMALGFFYKFQNDRIGDINPAAAALRKPLAEMQLIGVGGTKIEPIGKAASPTAGDGADKTGEEDDVDTANDVVDNIPEVGNPDVLDPEMKSAIRGYMIDLLAVQSGKNFVLRYDETRDKIILAHSKGAAVQYQIGKYFEFITRLTLVFGLSFQLPVVVTILVKLELLTARVMRSTRTYAWVIIMVAAAVLTPPDLVTLSLLAGPMIILYEICVIIASILERNREKKELEEEEKRRSRLDRLYSKSPEDLSEEEKAELHKHEVDQYEKEHANLYDDDGHEYDENGHLIGYDPHHDDHNNHDESWHDDHDYWHDGEEEGDEPVDGHHDADGDDDEEGAKAKPFKPIQDWPDKDPEMESDHAEPTMDSDDDVNENEDHDVCDPSGPVVDMNNASMEELMDLPGVDEWMANMIIDHRPYESFEYLEEIVGEDKVAEWMERLMLG